MIGHESTLFAWAEDVQVRGSALKDFAIKLQNKLVAGPILDRINRKLLQTVQACRPDALFVFRGTHIYPSSLARIKSLFPGITLVGYNNDDPFASGHSAFLWKHFLAGIPYYDCMFAYRYHNIAEYYQAGAKQVRLLRSWYMPESNYRIELDAADLREYASDVVFVGHYEHDGRLDVIRAIASLGVDVKLFGTGWDQVVACVPGLASWAPIRRVSGDEYNKALSGSKLALCFLSKLNRDTYTRRCFEIPATRTVMLSEYTDDLASLFMPDREAVYFRTTEEACQKVRELLQNEAQRLSIAEAGFNRLKRDGHDIVARMGEVSAVLSSMKREKGLI